MVAQSVEKYEAMADLQLAGCVAHNDPSALRLVMQRNNQRLFRAAWGILRNRSEAEARNRSRCDMVGGNGGNVVNIRFTSRMAARIKIMIPSGRWIATSR